MQRILLAVLAIVVLAGCAAITEEENLGGEVQSVTDAGITSLTREPVIVEEGYEDIGERTHLTFGKEYGSFRAKVDLTCDGGDPIMIDVEATEVAAFAGQQIGASAAVAIQQYLTQQNIEISQVQAGALTDIVTGIIKAAFPTPSIELTTPPPDS